ncbi:CIC11C00000000441 [Sungouiella intermedia]|uniref:CIC11C00000000441 n=1 Tax=Sungouiella intermedia TaxID=45354 RepID=A0A1L0BCQ2_9ASCO|nr:CIC11C00000000441 [[Candida] intermedia]
MAPVITRPPSDENLSTSYNETIPLGEYLFLRIAQANPKMKSIFGIPGDFNLALLEHLYSDSVATGKNLEFVGICNELNAAYAADGYSKAIDGLSVLITTYGVGELSALNGIAGAFAEFAPVLHIVGTTALRQSSQAQRVSSPSEIVNIHHLVQNKNALAPPNHDVYKRVVEDFSVAQETLDSDNSVENLARIDRVISTILRERRPGYLFVPSDMPNTLVPRSHLQVPFAFSELNDEQLLNNLSLRILSKLYAAEKPSVLSDTLTSRFGVQDALNDFVEKLPVNFVKLFSTAMARNVDETLPNFVGVYQGFLSADDAIVNSMEKDTDFLLTLGALNNEINSGRYTVDTSNIKDRVDVHPDYVLIDGEYVNLKNSEGYRAFSIGDLLSKLTSDFNANKFLFNDGKINNINYKYVPQQFSLKDTVDERVITQNKLTDFFNNYLREDDILIVETCSFLFAVSDLSFPKGVQFFSQNFYGSIGYALPATLGLSRAVRDLGSNRRVILVQGDGSAQMTIQELSSFLRYDVQPPKIFLLNNEGYTVERIIMGPTRSYNDIQDTWRWTDFFKIFGDAKGAQHVSTIVDTPAQLQEVMERGESGKIEMNELRLPKFDVPVRFKRLLGQ